MDKSTTKSYIASELQAKGCIDTNLCMECADKALEARDILSTFDEVLTYALSLYQAKMWGRKKVNENIKQEKAKIKKAIINNNNLFDEEPDYSSKVIKFGGFILKRKKKG